MYKQIHTQEVVNLHTHSHYCGHGDGEVVEYAHEGIKQGLQVLGMSEHCPVPDNRWRYSRMPYSRLASYQKDCLAVRDMFAGKLEIVRGFECDYLPSYRSYFEDLREVSDYLFFAVHDLSLDINDEISVFYRPLTKKNLHAYTKAYIQGIESGLFLFGAHPDLFCFSYWEWDEEALACSKAIIECAVDHGVALEVNGNGMRRAKVETSEGLRYAYPHHKFWKLASEYPLKVICNSDAHKPEFVHDSIGRCMEFAQECTLNYSRYLLEKDNAGQKSTITILD